MAQPRLLPGGRVCMSNLDEALMTHSIIIRNLMALVTKNISREEEYKIIAQTINHTHEASKLLEAIKKIYEKE